MPKREDRYPSTEGLWDTSKHTPAENREHNREVIKREEEERRTKDALLRRDQEKFGLLEPPQTPPSRRRGK